MSSKPTSGSGNKAIHVDFCVNKSSSEFTLQKIIPAIVIIIIISPAIYLSSIDCIKSIYLVEQETVILKSKSVVLKLWYVHHCWYLGFYSWEFIHFNQ